MKICFLDTIGLVYNGDTLKQKGLGGSESAIILLTKELAKIGMEVTVYNKCDIPGRYDNVVYKDLSSIPENKETFDILISSRNVLVYGNEVVKSYVMERYNFNIDWFKSLTENSKYKVLWMHDTFCTGDEFIQEFLADKLFDEIFNLSDWHYSYVSNASHVTKRYPELFKKNTFHTRNGIVNYKNEIDISKKDPNHFVYNASLPKGMKELITEMWPMVYNRYPYLKLTVIGGYYDLGVVDGFQNDFNLLKEEYEGMMGIHFTGIIKQDEIADILEDATYFLYPNIYPETFGISVTEAINYNVLLVGVNFGALEEIAPDSVSYKTEFPYNFDDLQKNRLLYQVDMALKDTYLKQQKQYACNEFKPFLGWDVVSLQWKHHFFKKLGLYLSISEIRKHRYNISNINRMYKKVCINPEEYFEDYSCENKNTIIVVSPFYNAEAYIKDHILSVASQNYDNYKHIIIDDLSTDNSYEIAKQTINNLPHWLKIKFELIKNETKLYAVGNQVETLNYILKDCFEHELINSTIIVLLDGDDTLVNDPDIFNYLNRLYNKGIKFTYGSCYSVADKINLIAQPYPKEVILNKTFREHKFNWGMPYTHLRTFSLGLFNEVDQSVFKDENGEYWKSGGDNSTFYPLIEECGPNEIYCVQRVLVNYNDVNPLNDYKVNGTEQNLNRDKILEK